MEQQNSNPSGLADHGEQEQHYVEVIRIDHELEVELSEGELISGSITTFRPDSFTASTPVPSTSRDALQSLPSTSRPSHLRNLFSTSTQPVGSGSSPGSGGTRRTRQLTLTGAVLPDNEQTPKKRKSQAARATPSSSTPQKRRRWKSTPGKRAQSNQAGPESATANGNSPTTNIEDDDYHPNSPQSEEEETSGDTVGAFSIHWLPVKRLQEKFEKGKKILSEAELITKIMNTVNMKYTSESQGRPAFEERRPSREWLEENSSDSYDFQVVAYVQVITCRDRVLSQFGIEDDSCIGRINKIIFYYRKGEIFALTFANTWMHIQVYCCYDFPWLVSGRLTSTEGNVQETKKPLTGIVRTVKSTNKYSILADQLKNVRLNVTKELRRDSSLYSLKEFSNSQEQTMRDGGERGQVKINFGLALIRILRQMELKNVPEILNHLAHICNGNPTFTFPQGRDEVQVNDFPKLRIVPAGENFQELETSLDKIIYDFLHNQRSHRINQFGICDKYIEDYGSMDSFDLIYETSGPRITSVSIKKFNKCPTAFEVFAAVRENCEALTRPQDFSTFSNKLRKYLKVEYTRCGSAESVRRRLIDLVEGELQFEEDGNHYWKIMGQWFSAHDEHYSAVHNEFLELLRKEDIFRIPSSLVDLRHPWRRTDMESVQAYVESYEGIEGYYLPPSEDDLVGMSSQPMTFEETEEDDDGNHNLSRASITARGFLGAKFLFDLLYVKKEEDRTCETTIYYIYDKFDPSIRDASTKISKSLELLMKDAKCKLLEKFYSHYSHRNRRFLTLFPSYDEFKSHITKGNNVTVVVAFLTKGIPPVEVVERGTIPGMLGRTSRVEEVNPDLSLRKEKEIYLSFNDVNVRTMILGRLSDQTKEIICNELGIPFAGGEFDPLDVAEKFIDMLVERGYCDASESSDKPINGKFLKLRHASSFQLFNNRRVNEEVFNVARESFISQFPGFIHKLECFEIYGCLSAYPRLSLKFTEIDWEPIPTPNSAEQSSG